MSSKSPLTENDWMLHLSGRKGVGLAPILDDGTCRWGAIDIDNHRDGGGVPLEDIAKLLAMHELPGIACRSKSGSVHIYMFFGFNVTAYDARAMMLAWSKAMHLNTYSPDNALPERFPKQNETTQTSYPSWINLPYFGITQKNPYGDRYAYYNGQKLTVDEFIDWAKNNIIWSPDVTKLINYESPPPCVLGFRYYKIQEGGRNNALYNAVIALHQMHPKQLLAKAREFNEKAFFPPLPDSEVTKTVNRIQQGIKTGYLCKEYPANEYCDMERCSQLKYGQSALLERLGPDKRAAAGKERKEKKKKQDMNEFWSLIKNKFQFLTLTRYEYDNVIFVMDCKLKENDSEVWTPYKISLTASDLIRYDRVRVLILEKMNYGLPSVKPNIWNEIVNDLIQTTEKGFVTADATAEGMKMREVIKYIKMAEMSASGNPPRLSDASRGRPFIYLDKHKNKHVAFGYGELCDYLRNQRVDTIGEEFFETNSKFKNVSFKISNENKVMWSIEFNPHWDVTQDLLERSQK